jgi:hypothetical protein
LGGVLDGGRCADTIHDCMENRELINLKKFGSKTEVKSTQAWQIRFSIKLWNGGKYV